MSEWTENSVPAAALIEYANNVTDEKSADFIPQKDRIAVFDLDGTLLCDDTVRENGNIKKAKRMEDICREKGWYTISMKNDWTTIFGDNVTTAP